MFQFFVVIVVDREHPRDCQCFPNIKSHVILKLPVNREREREERERERERER